MKRYFQEWQEISIRKRNHKVSSMTTGIGIMEEDRDSDRFMFKLVTYTPGINKFGSVQEEEHRAQKEAAAMFSVDLRHDF